VARSHPAGRGRWQAASARHANPASGRFGPYDLQGWAKREGLEIGYIDNRYLNVPMDRAKLRKFLNELYDDADSYPDAVLASLGLQWETTIWAEEF
jgi:hypothetical protein